MSLGAFGPPNLRGQPSQLGALFVGFDGIAGGHGEVRGKVVNGKPADFLCFFGLAVSWLPAKDSSQERGRNPVLMLAGEAVLGNAQQRLDGDVDTDFFASFANRTVLERFEIIQLSTDNTPATCLRGKNAEGEQDPLAMVHQKHADADTRIRKGMRGGA